jgi:hypothetical protein
MARNQSSIAMAFPGAANRLKAAAAASFFLMVRSASSRVSNHEAMQPSFETALTRLLRMRIADYIPPILQTIFHSSAVTGCTDNREYFTSAMSLNRLSALIAAIVTGVFNGFSAFKSTQTNLPVLSLGSG